MKKAFLLVPIVTIFFVMPLVVSAQNHGKRKSFGRHHVSLAGRHDRGLHRGWYKGRHLGWYKNGRNRTLIRTPILGTGRVIGKNRGRGPKR